MRKPSLFLGLALAVVAGASQVGCRMCQNCLDYSSPVQGSSCGGCQDCRSGSCLGRAEGVATSPMIAQQPGATTVQ